MFEAIKWAIIRRSKDIIKDEVHHLIDLGVEELNEELREERGLGINLEEEELKSRLKGLVDEQIDERWPKRD